MNDQSFVRCRARYYKVKTHSFNVYFLPKGMEDNNIANFDLKSSFTPACKKVFCITFFLKYPIPLFLSLSSFLLLFYFSFFFYNFFFKYVSEYQRCLELRVVQIIPLQPLRYLWCWNRMFSFDGPPEPTPSCTLMIYCMFWGDKSNNYYVKRL